MERRITLITNTKTTKLAALVKGNELWIPVDALESTTGFELKSSGACYTSLDICIPLIGGDFVYENEKGKWFNISKLAVHLEQPCIASVDESVWSLGAMPQQRQHMLNSGLAPDFEIVDIYGEQLRLSDFRGKKVLLVTWATWCGCRFDVAAWQRLYEELSDPNFEIICVAQDAQGEAVAKKWFIDAQANYKCVVDSDHTISSLFGWVNVPTGAWIDEQGKIVRVNEAAYAEKHEIKNVLLKTEFGNNAFGNATKDWVNNGLIAEIEQSKEQLNANIRSKKEEDLLADAYFKLGLYYQKQNEKTEAEVYFKNARELAPNNWNIQRQSWTFKSTFHAVKNWNRITRANAASDANWTYYQAMDLAGAPKRRTTRITFFWEPALDWCKRLLGKKK